MRRLGADEAMANLEGEPLAGYKEKQLSSTEPADRRRQKLIAIGFFAFFVILWLVIHLLQKALTRANTVEIGQSRFQVVEVTPGSSVSDIADKLASEQLISSKLLFKLAAVARRSTRELKAGEYRFERSMSMMDVLSWLEQGRVTLHRFTVPEGFTFKEIAGLLESMELADAEEFIRLAGDPEFCEEAGVGGPNLEGFLFPDTYKIARGLPTKKVLRIMVDRFWSVCSGEIQNEIAASGLKLRDVVTIASIIEKESLYDDEKPLVASVIYNRLHRNMPLQCDVTIRYPLDNYGAHLTYADLRMDSPYNSYLNAGLPPTPICNPGLPAIRAALKPAKTDYLYFVSMNNGRHKFSTSLREHNDAVFKYQILNVRG